MLGRRKLCCSNQYGLLNELYTDVVMSAVCIYGRSL